MDISEVKSQFPIFSKKINGKQLVYLDSSNSAQKPISVIKSLDNFYKNEFSNIGRSIHTLSVNATNKFEETRMNVKNFINASSKDESDFDIRVMLLFSINLSPWLINEFDPSNNITLLDLEIIMLSLLELNNSDV